MCGEGTYGAGKIWLIRVKGLAAVFPTAARRVEVEFFSGSPVLVGGYVEYLLGAVHAEVFCTGSACNAPLLVRRWVSAGVCLVQNSPSARTRP